MSKAISSSINKDSDIDNEVEKFYADHEKEIDEAFSQYCFYEGNFEFADQKKMFNDDRVFWEFVENYMFKNQDQAAAMYNYEMVNQLSDVIFKVFPNSFLSISTSGPLGSKDVYVHFALGKTKEQWEHGIIHNDPLYTVFRVEGWDTGYDGFVEDPKTVKGTFLTGVRGVKFPTNKMSPETFVKKIGEYFKKIKEHHESQSTSTANIESDLPKLQKISDAFSHLNPEAGQYLASYLFYYAAHDHMVDVEDDMGVYEENADNLPVLRSNNAQDFDKLQAQKIQEVADIASELGEDAAKCLNIMLYNNFEIYDGERSPEFSEFQKKMEAIDKASGQQVDRQNGNNDAGYYDSKNSQYVVINDHLKSGDKVEHPEHGKGVFKQYFFKPGTSEKVAIVKFKNIGYKPMEVGTSVKIDDLKKATASTEDELAPGYLEQISKEISIEEVIKEGEPTETYVGDLSVTYGNGELSCFDKNGTLYIWVVDVINGRPNYSHYETIVNASTKASLTPRFKKALTPKEQEYQDKTKQYEKKMKEAQNKGDDAAYDRNAKLWRSFNDKARKERERNESRASAMNEYVITIEFTTDATLEEVEEIASHCYTQLETLGDEYGRVHTPSNYNVKKVGATASHQKVIAMNDVIMKAELINSKIGSVSGDWEKELDMKFSEAADVDFESTYSNGNDSISLIDMYVFLKDKSLKVKLGIAGDTDCETEEICGKLISAEYSVDGKEFFPFSHFSNEYTNRKLEEGELLEAGEKALKEQQELIEKQEKANAKELEKLKKEYEVKASE
jgi:hypothetical protein